jgi:signal transduction histidine kinase
MNPNIELLFHENIPEQIILLPNTALHVFRICQEAFSNAIKHSKATIIEVHISANTEKELEFKITDNGSGFNFNEGNKNGHYGLENMHSRAKEIDANLSITSKHNFGTSICINFKNNTYV